MTKTQIEGYRLKLLRLLERLRPDVGSVEEQARVGTGGEAGGGLSNAPLHLGDIASATLSQGLDAVLLENEQALLREMHHALGRMDEGRYGRCELCDGDIESKRLRAIPYARLCLRCAAADEVHTETLNLNSGRPKWETETIAAEEKLVEDRDSRREMSGFTNQQGVDRPRSGTADLSAAGMPGGGSAIGGLAGTNFGRGNPNPDDLARVMGADRFDPDDADGSETIPLAGHAGGAVGGTPAGKRSRPSAARSRSAKQ